MYHINAEQWVDLEILEDLNIDSESGISFSSIDSDGFKKMVSNPVVTAVESNCIWFVKWSDKIYIALGFTPFDFIMRFIAALNQVPNKRGPISL